MKRFTNNKLHEFVERKFPIDNIRFYLKSYHDYRSLNYASENDIAGFLQDELKISSFPTDWDKEKWSAYHETTGHISNDSRTQAIFDVAEQIMEGM